MDLQKNDENIWETNKNHQREIAHRDMAGRKQIALVRLVKERKFKYFGHVKKAAKPKMYWREEWKELDREGDPESTGKRMSRTGVD